MRYISSCLIFTFIFLLINCSDSSKSQFSDEYLRGKHVYNQNCISCHNPDPRLLGVLAPDIAGSKEEVIRSMILTGKPPKGVKPKWPDAEMAPLPHLESEVPYIYEYLKAFK